MQVWEELAEIPECKEAFQCCRTSGAYYEDGIHACFDFDFRVPKDAFLSADGSASPACAGDSILLSDASGTVESRGTERAGKPYLKSEQYAMPVFYRDVMYRESSRRERRGIP